MSLVKIARLRKNPTKDNLFQGLIVDAIQTSIISRNTGPANELLMALPRFNKNESADEALIKYFETWGRLCYSEGKLKYARHLEDRVWTDEYKAKVTKLPWTALIAKSTKPSNAVINAEKEFRVVLDRLLRASEDSSKTIIHSLLVGKMQEALNSYGRSDEWMEQDKKYRTIFDQSVKTSTVSASKYAKGS